MTPTPLVESAIYISAIFSTEVVALVCACLVVAALGFITLRNIKVKDIFKETTPSIIKTITLIVGSTAIAAILAQAFKHIFKIARPIDMLVQETGFSFPSGHATLTVAFFSAVIVSLCLFYKNLPKPLFKLKVWVSILIMIGVCASRLVLHVHRVEDVVCGALLGLASTLFVQSFFKR